MPVFAMSLTIVVVIGAVLLWVALTYNRFIRARNLVREAWSGIDVQLKRRHDLIPNMLETVKGYAAHERSVLADVTALRGADLNSANVQARGTAENALTQSIKTLFAVAEAYPDLKANQSFLALQQTLGEIEDEIQYARRYYNGTVRDFNILVESFPSTLLAQPWGYHPEEYFEIELATERHVPEVHV